MSTQNDPINTAPIQQFISQVKSADAGRQREIRLDIQQAKTLAFTLGIVMTRLNGDLEKILMQSQTNTSEEIIQISMDGGSNWK